MPKTQKKHRGLKKAVRRRHRFKPATDNSERKLISRLELSRTLGCSTMTIIRMEKRNGGTLDEVKLRGPLSTTYYRVEQINAAFGIDVNAPNKAA